MVGVLATNYTLYFYKYLHVLIIHFLESITSLKPKIFVVKNGLYHALDTKIART